MVVIHIKKGDGDGFLYETTCDTSNDTIIREIVNVFNLRLVLVQLVGGLRQLAKYGPMKHPEKQSLDEIDEKYNGTVIDKNEYYEADPSGIRTGNGVGPQMTEMIERVCADTETVLDKNNVTRKVATTRAVLTEKLENMRGVVIMAFPQGLPEYENVRIAIEENSSSNMNGTPNPNYRGGVSSAGLDGTPAAVEFLEEDTAELWIASRCLDRREKFCDRYGRNEKTKLIGKMQKLGGGAPGREAAVSEEERKAMMAFYFKKQEEAKKIAENNEDDYLNSVWANPKQLQQSLRGQGVVKAPGIR